MTVHPLAAGGAPAWASEWGEDPFGPFAVLEVGHARQRMRWIPPGTYWRGSPEDEAGRLEIEGPRHRVTLTRGFWLGDTPVTQALWEAVTGERPSRFLDPRRPVEQVSWNDVQRFVDALRERVPSLRPRLPTEAEWEWACRAGTQGVRWLEDGAEPALTDVAWFVDNQREEFDFEGHARGTRAVATRRPNPWGLYDVLGNVWEWCRGRVWVVRGRGPARPLQRARPPAGRPGGGWGYSARLVRAACRNALEPGYRYHDLWVSLGGRSRCPEGGALIQSRRSLAAAGGGTPRASAERSSASGTDGFGVSGCDCTPTFLEQRVPPVHATTDSGRWARRWWRLLQCVGRADNVVSAAAGWTKNACPLLGVDPRVRRPTTSAEPPSCPCVLAGSCSSRSSGAWPRRPARAQAPRICRGPAGQGTATRAKLTS